MNFGFCDIQNNQGRGESYKPQHSALADNPYRGLGYSGFHKNLTLTIVFVYITQVNGTFCARLLANLEVISHASTIHLQVAEEKQNSFLSL